MIKKIICIFLLYIFIQNISWGQNTIVTSDQDASIDIPSLLEKYPKALSDQQDENAVFENKQEYFYTKYLKFVREFSYFLKTNNFKWGRQVRCSTNIFFSSNGNIDYFIYKFKQGSIPDEKRKEYEKLLTVFLKTYEFGLKAETPFSICGQLTYMDVD